MWKLWNRLFGWHYVYAETGTGILTMIRRVRTTAAGERYIKGYGGGIVFLDRANDRWMVTPLTWVEPPETGVNKRKFKVVN